MKTNPAAAKLKFLLSKKWQIHTHPCSFTCPCFARRGSTMQANWSTQSPRACHTALPELVEWVQRFLSKPQPSTCNHVGAAPNQVQPAVRTHHLDGSLIATRDKGVAHRVTDLWSSQNKTLFINYSFTGLSWKPTWTTRGELLWFPAGILASSPQRT
jgi:hypothetical protein